MRSATEVPQHLPLGDLLPSLPPWLKSRSAHAMPKKPRRWSLYNIYIVAGPERVLCLLAILAALVGIATVVSAVRGLP